METSQIKLPVDKSTPIVIAVSGGRDSMCLLDILIKKEQKLIIAFVNHHQRLEAEIEEAYIRRFAADKQLALEVLEYYPENHTNFQAEAHHARYAFFYQVAQKYGAKYVLTAHHQDDTAETIILRLIKGSNLYGYGISKLTPYKDIYIYRPLIDFSRAQIDNYITQNKIFYFEDKSNDEDDYLRNRIRHQILPLLKAENPNILNTMTNFSLMCKETFDYIRKDSLSYLDKHANHLDLISFNSLDIVLKKDIINLWLERHQIECNNNKILTIIEALASEKAQFDLHLANKYILRKSYNQAFITTKTDKNQLEPITLYPEEKKSFGKYTFHLTKNMGNTNANYLKICYNSVKLPITIRTRKPGDRIQMPYGSKKIKNLLIDKKVPLNIREEIPVVTAADDEILWVYGYLKKPTEATEVIYLICEVNDVK